MLQTPPESLQKDAKVDSKIDSKEETLSDEELVQNIDNPALDKNSNYSNPNSDFQVAQPTFQLASKPPEHVSDMNKEEFELFLNQIVSKFNKRNVDAS